jgi:hypothetical protein
VKRKAEQPEHDRTTTIAQIKLAKDFLPYQSTRRGLANYL